MNHKSKVNAQDHQHLPAGVSPSDHNIEFVGVAETKTVLWFQNGNSHQWKYLSPSIYDALEELFLTDHEALKFLTGNYPAEAHNTNRMVELYTYYMYGQLDKTPDVIDGVLQNCENLRESKNCPSLKFSNKYIDIDGVHLSARDLQILDDIIEGLPDKMIASRLGIAIGTFDFHKKNLFTKLKVDSKVGLAVKTLKYNVPCAS